MKRLMTLTKGARLICLDDSISGIDVNTPYTFLGYDEASVLANDLHVTMSWYPSRPIWTKEDYEIIRFTFMRIRLDGVENSMRLKDFELYQFTD